MYSIKSIKSLKQFTFLKISSESIRYILDLVERKIFLNLIVFINNQDEIKKESIDGFWINLIGDENMARVMIYSACDSETERRLSLRRTKSILIDKGLNKRLSSELYVYIRNLIEILIKRIIHGGGFGMLRKRDEIMSKEFVEEMIRKDSLLKFLT